MSDDKIYCFDYFDTLIVRNVAPEHTKKMASSLLSQLLGLTVSADELYELRSALEKQLCDERAACGGELEFYLPDLAKVLRPLLLQKVGSYPVLQSEDYFVQMFLDLETVVELNVQQPCLETIAVLQQLKKAKQQTVLISDFYLPGTHFHQMLRHFELFDLFEHVFISADHALAKGSGRLYEKVCSDLGCNPEQMVMIGDNHHSDIHRAREKGIDSIHIQNPVQTEFYESWNKTHLSSSDVNKHFSLLANTTGPFREMECSLWLFTVKLFQQLMQNSVTDVFFFSKEGEFLKKLFDQFQNDLFGRLIIKSHYLLVSRKATFLASLNPLGEESFDRLFAHYRDISLRDFLLSLNIEESVAAALCQQIDLDFDTRQLDLKNSVVFKQLLDAEEFQQLYEERRTTQRRNCITYLDSFGVDYAADGLAIVDVGWKGSIQDNVFHILQGQVRVQGYFVGSLIATEKNTNNIKEGLLFDDSPEPTSYFTVYNNNRSLFEMVLGASHGSADGYFTKEQFAALPDDHQRTVQQRIPTSDGDLCIATLDLPEERKLFIKVIKPLQDQIFKSIPLFNRSYLESGCILPDEEWFARQHARMVFTPDKKEIDFFESLYHLENFGVFEYTDFKTNAKLSIKQRLRNLKNIMRDQGILEMGTWPPIILRRLGIGSYRFIDGRKRNKRAFK